MTATKQDFFKPTELSADADAKQTNSSARGILDADAAARNKKTEALRALRLGQTRNPYDLACDNNRSHSWAVVAPLVSNRLRGVAKCRRNCFSNKKATMYE